MDFPLKNRNNYQAQKTSVKCRLMNLIALEDWERRCRDSRKMFHEEFTRRKILKNSNKLFSRTNFALLSIDTFRATFSLPLSLSLISFLLNLYFLLYFYTFLYHLIYCLILVLYSSSFWKIEEVGDRDSRREKDEWGKKRKRKKEGRKEYSWGVTKHSRGFFSQVLTSFTSLCLLLPAVSKWANPSPHMQWRNWSVSWNFTKYWVCGPS